MQTLHHDAGSVNEGPVKHVSTVEIKPFQPRSSDASGSARHFKHSPFVHVIMLVIPGAMEAGLSDPLFWGSLLLSLVLAGAVAFPVNRWRGKDRNELRTAGSHHRDGDDRRHDGRLQSV